MLRANEQFLGSVGSRRPGDFWWLPIFEAKDEWRRKVDYSLRFCTTATLTRMRVYGGQGLVVVLDGGWLGSDDRELRTRRKSARTEQGGRVDLWWDSGDVGLVAGKYRDGRRNGKAWHVVRCMTGGQRAARLGWGRGVDEKSVAHQVAPSCLSARPRHPKPQGGAPASHSRHPETRSFIAGSCGGPEPRYLTRRPKLERFPYRWLPSFTKRLRGRRISTETWLPEMSRS